MYEISLQTYIPTLILKCEPKSGLSCRRQVVHPRPQTPQGESVAKPETPLLIILSIACKWGPCKLSIVHTYTHSIMHTHINLHYATRKLKFVPDTNREIKALTISSLSGPAVWLRSSNNPMEADDINRQLCRINADGNGTILIDFLDLSYTGNTSQSSPYCVYWGKSDSICANKASERQVFQVQNHSNLHNTSFTILFWSNNYIQTTEARFWIEIRGR